MRKAKFYTTEFKEFFSFTRYKSYASFYAAAPFGVYGYLGITPAVCLSCCSRNHFATPGDQPFYIAHNIMLYFLFLQNHPGCNTDLIVRQISVKSGVTTAPYDKSIRLGMLILDIMGNIFKIRGNRHMLCVRQERVVKVVGVIIQNGRRQRHFFGVETHSTIV